MSANSKTVAQLEAMQTSTPLFLFPHLIHIGIDEFGSFRPVGARSSLAEEKVLWTEQLSQKALRERCPCVTDPRP